MGGLKSRFLDNYVMGSVTISYNGQGGQKRHSCLTHCYIFLQLAWLRQKRPAGENKWMQVSCELCLFLDRGVMDGFRPPTTQHRPKTQQWSSSKKKKKSRKTKTLNAAAKAGTDVQLMMQNWDRHTQEVIHLVRGNTFTHKELCFQPDSSLCAQALQTEWLNSAIPTWGVLFGLPQWCKKVKKWGMQQGEAHVTYSLS